MFAGFGRHCCLLRWRAQAQRRQADPDTSVEGANDPDSSFSDSTAEWFNSPSVVGDGLACNYNYE